MSKVSKTFDAAVKAAISVAREDLIKGGFVEGAHVRSPSGDFIMRKIKFSISPFSTGGWISVYGNRIRKNSSIGTHLHFIGHPEDLTKVCP